MGLWFPRVYFSIGPMFLSVCGFLVSVGGVPSVCCFAGGVYFVRLSVCLLVFAFWCGLLLSV